MPGESNQAVAEYCHTGAILMLRQLLNLNGAKTEEYAQLRSNMIKAKMYSLNDRSVE